MVCRKGGLATSAGPAALLRTTEQPQPPELWPSSVSVARLAATPVELAGVDRYALLHDRVAAVAELDQTEFREAREGDVHLLYGRKVVIHAAILTNAALNND